MKYYIFTTVLLALLFVNFGYSQNNKILFNYDYARFCYDDNSGLIEIYYSFYQNSMSVIIEENNKYYRGHFKIKINDNITNDILLNKEYQFEFPLVESDNNSPGKDFVGNIGFILPFGDYSCTLIGWDATNEFKKDTVTFFFQLSKIHEDKFTVSDIQLASSIKKENVNETSQYYKNSYEVVPNPTGIFGMSIPVVYYYAEIYNVTKNIISKHLKVEQILLNSKNQVLNNKSKYISRNYNALVEVGAINISKYPNGTYFIALAVSDSVENITAVITKKFFIYNPSITDSAITNYAEMEYVLSEYASMNEEEIEESFMVSKYIAQKKEIEQWEKITDIDAKRLFLFNFWKERDGISTSIGGGIKKEYYRRVDYSNNNYSSIRKKGWKTDRGRIYILYGEPTEIERFPNQTDMRPFEIWKYDQIESGVIFVFGDLYGLSDYELIHSTKIGELRDDNYTRKLIIN